MDKLIISNRIEIKQDENIYDFIGQFQSLTKKIICLINKTKLHLYDEDDNDYPKRIKLSHKDHSNKSMTIYHFNDIDTKDNYCIFGKEFARKFLNNIEKKNDKSNKFPYIKSTININIKDNSMLKIIDNNQITIIDNGNKIKFIDHNPLLKIETIID